MQHELGASPFAVFPVAPPYTDFGPAMSACDPRLRDLPPGSILALRADESPCDLPALEGSLSRIRHSHPTIPVVLRVREHLDVEAARLIALAAQLHVRGVIVDGQPVRETLRRVLTEPVDLGADVEEWLSLRRPQLPPDLSSLIRQIFRYAATGATVVPLLKQIGESERTARARFRKRALPPPGCWLQAARAVHAALRVQRDQSTPLLTLAVRLGYSDHSALSHQLLRMFGVRGRTVRRLLGWEWLLDQWLLRHTARTPARS